MNCQEKQINCSSFKKLVNLRRALVIYVPTREHGNKQTRRNGVKTDLSGRSVAKTEVK